MKIKEKDSKKVFKILVDVTEQQIQRKKDIKNKKSYSGKKKVKKQKLL
ncbi:hypothetical protein [Wolbachia endosymbiont of Chironomus riparius]|nr:hypothetical protein [Wolbachia endosymbiont of Chironomus riparius]